MLQSNKIALAAINELTKATATLKKPNRRRRNAFGATPL
jgi:hypothetical protein